MDWRRTRDATASNWSSSSSYDPPASRTYATRSSQSDSHNSTGRSDASSDQSDYFFRQANRARQLASNAGTTRPSSQFRSNPKPRHGYNSPHRPTSVGRTSINSEVSGQIFSNSADRVESSSSTGTQRRDSELVNEQPRPPRSEQRRLVRNGFISPLNIERIRSSVDAEVNVDPEAPVVHRVGAISILLPVSQELEAENRNGQHRPPRSTERKLVRKCPSSVSIEPVSSNPGSSSSQPSNSSSTRILRSQSTHRNRQVQSDEMLARQLQQGLFNEMHGIDNVIVANASIARQNLTPPRTDGGGAAAARTNDILQIQRIQRDFNGNDYEMLLALDENNHQHSGASESQINSLPQSIIQNADDSQEDPCGICRDTPAVGDAIRHLPCFHKFHKDCIDLWLERKPLCPICKSDVR